MSSSVAAPAAVQLPGTAFPAAGAAAERIAVVRASTGAIDREGESIAPGAWDTTAFEQNPVILFAHDHTRVVGRAERIWRDAQGLWLQVRLAAAGTSPHADEVWALLAQGMLRAVSVGFIPRTWEDTAAGRRYTRVELTECSFVAVPANPEALVAEVRSADADKKDLLRGYRRLALRLRRQLAVPALQQEDAQAALLLAALQSAAADGVQAGLAPRSAAQAKAAAGRAASLAIPVDKAALQQSLQRAMSRIVR